MIIDCEHNKPNTIEASHWHPILDEEIPSIEIRCCIHVWDDLEDLQWNEYLQWK